MKRAIPVIAVLLFAISLIAQDDGKPEHSESIGQWRHMHSTDAMTDEQKSVFVLPSRGGAASSASFMCTNTGTVTPLMIDIPDAIKQLAKGKARLMVRLNHGKPETITVDTKKAGRWVALDPEWVFLLLTSDRFVVRFATQAGKERTVEFINDGSPLEQIYSACSNKDFKNGLREMEQLKQQR